MIRNSRFISYPICEDLVWRKEGRFGSEWLPIKLKPWSLNITKSSQRNFSWKVPSVKVTVGTALSVVVCYCSAAKVTLKTFRRTFVIRNWCVRIILSFIFAPDFHSRWPHSFMSKQLYKQNNCGFLVLWKEEKFDSERLPLKLKPWYSNIKKSFHTWNFSSAKSTRAQSGSYWESTKLEMIS